MKFSKEEKKFWKMHYHFDKPSQLHENWQQLWSVDSDIDDDFLCFFSLRVSTIVEVHLKETLIGDKAIEYMTNFKNLQVLYIRNHPNITNACIPFINQMSCLESLNLTKTPITLTDLYEQLNNRSLREVFLDSKDDEAEVLEMAFVLKQRMPNCHIYLNCSFTTNVFGIAEKPIF